MAKNPIERALGVWSAANYRNVMLPGLGVVTCGELCDAIAALQAENEEQRERLIQFANAFDAGYAAAERALAERAGGVKVLREAALMLLSEIDAAGDINSIVGASNPLRKALHALTTEPAAPEGRQDNEPRAYIVHAPEDDYYGTGPDRLQFHPLAQHDMDNGYRQIPLYGRPALELSGNTGELIDKKAEAIRGDTTSDDAPWATLSEDRKIGWRGDAERALAVVKEHLTARRPSEQAVTEAMRRIRDYADKPHADRYVIRNMAEYAIKAAMEAGR